MSANSLNERFKTVYKLLKEKGEIVKSSPTKSKSIFALNIFGNKSYGFLIDKCLRNERKIKLKHAQRLTKHYEVRLDYMIKGELPVFEYEEEEFLPARPMNDEVRPVHNQSSNILFSTAAAVASNTFDVGNEEETEHFRIPGIGVHGEHVAFMIDGNSMYPTIASGDMVICRPLHSGERMIENQIYVVRTFDNNLLVKRVQKEVGHNKEIVHLKLISDNYMEHDPFLVPIEEIRDLLKVVHKVTPL